MKSYMETQGTEMPEKKDNVINIEDKRWQNVFNNDLQKAFEEVVGVLEEHLPPNVGKGVALAIAEAMYVVSDSLINHFDPPKEGEDDGFEIIFEPDWHEGHEPQPTRDH